MVARFQQKLFAVQRLPYRVYPLAVVGALTRVLQHRVFYGHHVKRVRAVFAPLPRVLPVLRPLLLPKRRHKKHFAYPKPFHKSELLKR